MIDFYAAKMWGHRRNIERLCRLLATELTDLERQYLHKRIAEEHFQLERLERAGRPLREFTEAFARRPERNQGKPVAVKFMASMEEGPAVRAGPR